MTGNGVQTVGQSAGAHFDYTGSGFAQATGWAAPQDGILVMPDANGRVTKGSELFGNNTVLPNGTLASNGFVALAALDSNHDGVIDAKDPAFSQLRLWVGGNGQPGSGQLLTLAQAGIQSLNLSYTTQNFTDANGNQIRQFGSYTLTNGTTRAMDDVWYSINSAETINVSTPVAVSATIAALPNLIGAGNLHGLQQAMALDTSGKLTGLVQAFASAANTMTLAQARTSAEAILLDWTGADKYSATSRGPYIDGRDLYALEAFMGQGYLQKGSSQPAQDAAVYLQQAYGKLLDWTTAQLLAQTKFAPWINEVALTWNATTNSLGMDVSKVVATLSGLYSSAPTQGAAWMNEFAQSLKGMGTAGTQILTALHQQGSVSGTGFSLALATMGYTLVNGSATNGTLSGVLNQDSMLLGVSGESLVGANGNDLLVAGGGVETFTAGTGNDTFMFNKGSGQLLIKPSYQKTATTDQDVVRLGVGLTPSGTTMTRDRSNNLILNFGNGDQITISSYFINVLNQPAIVFADGTTWNPIALPGNLSLQDTSAGGNTLNGAIGLNDTIVGAAGDTINAGNLNDTITAGKNSTINAGAGVDTILYNVGSGLVVLNEANSKIAGTTINLDVIKLGTGITAAATQVTRDLSNNLILGFGNGDQLKIPNYFDTALNQPSFVFTDGTTWSPSSIMNQVVLVDTTSGNRSLYGQSGVNNHIVGAANDTIQAGNLNDTITVGKNNTVYAGAGVDTFVFNAGSGLMVLNESSKTAGTNQDVVKLGPGITAASTTITRDLYSNLNLGFGNGDQLKLTGYFYNTTSRPTVVFADGTTWNYAAITNQLVFADTTSGGTYLNGLYGVNNRIIGAANDTITAGNLNDTITAGKGDTIFGGAGIDTVIYNAGSGLVTLNETYTSKTSGTNQDVVKLGAGITAAATQVSRDLSNSLILSLGNGDQIKIVGYFNGASNQPSISFADSTQWNYTSIVSKLVFADTTSGGTRLYGLTGVNNNIVGAANDMIVAGNLNDAITSGKGDTIYAGAGNDTFKVGSGTGAVTINEATKTGGANQDVLQLTGAKSNQLWFRAVGNNLEIDVLGTTDHVTINNWMSDPTTHVQQIQAADATMSPAAKSVALMVQAMASFGAPPATQTAYTPTEQAALAPLLASSWHH